MQRLVITALFILSMISSAWCQRLSEAEISIEEVFIAANQKKLLGKYDEAIELYKKVLAEDEVNAAVYHELARVYEAQKEMDQAVSNAKKATTLAPDNVWYRLTLASMQELSLDFASAAKTYEYIAKKEHDQSLYDRWANALIEAGDASAAVEVIDQTDEIWGWDESRSDTKVDLLLSLDKKKDAINEVKKWSEKYPDESRYAMKLAQFYLFIKEEKKAGKIVEDILSSDPTNEDAIAVQQALNSKKGNTDTDDLSTLVSNESISTETKVKSLMPIISRGDATAVKAILPLSKQISESAPEDPAAQALHADALYLTGDLTGAIQFYKRSIDKTKSVYQVWDQLMRCLQLTSDFEELNRISLQALDYYPNQAGPYYFQGIAKLEEGDLEEASYMAEEAGLISAGVGDISELSKVLQATITLQNGDAGEAMSKLGEIDQLQLPASFEVIGDIHAAAGDKKKAQEAYQRALEKGGNKARLEQKLQSI